MILGIDIGNTCIVMGILDDINSYKKVRINTHDDKISEALHVYDKYKIDDIIISSVVPSVEVDLGVLCVIIFGITPKYVKSTDKSNITIKINDPSSLGADLYTAVIAAEYLYSTPFIVVDLGTATKILVVNDKKEFLGGAISAGVVTSLNNLISSAELLNDLSFNDDLNVVGNDTLSCLGSGTLIGTACMIDGMIDRIINEVNLNNPTVILTGGLSNKVLKYINHDVILNEDLLLIGLKVIYDTNYRKEA